MSKRRKTSNEFQVLPPLLKTEDILVEDIKPVITTPTLPKETMVHSKHVVSHLCDNCGKSGFHRLGYRIVKSVTLVDVAIQTGEEAEMQPVTSNLFEEMQLLDQEMRPDQIKSSSGSVPDSSAASPILVSSDDGKGSLLLFWSFPVNRFQNSQFSSVLYLQHLLFSCH